MSKETVAYCGAGSAPTAVPFSCSQKPSLKEIMLFSIISTVLMLVCIAFASAVTILQPGGMIMR
eukprot:12593118-Ditylum_brightwellii.AAC.1